MKLFQIDPDENRIALNKEWIHLIPPFSDLIKRDKGSSGDYDGRRKLKAKKEFTFIYFYVDFSSPITDWEDEERWKESLYYAELEDKDIDEKVILAYKYYDELQKKSSRALRTYRSLLKAQNAMDSYFENLDMTAKDKKGELLNDPIKVGNSMAGLGKVFDNIEAFRKRTEQELKDAGTGIRGKAELGDLEEKMGKFSEMDIIHGSQKTANGTPITSFTMDDALKVIQQIDKNEISQEELDNAEEDDEK